MSKTYGKYAFYVTPTAQTVAAQTRHAARAHVSIVRPLSKRTAKHDKLAVRAFKYDSIKPYRAPDYAARNAGLVGTIH
jgi:hypothetical protein